MAEKRQHHETDEDEVPAAKNGPKKKNVPSNFHQQYRTMYPVFCSSTKGPQFTHKSLEKIMRLNIFWSNSWLKRKCVWELLISRLLFFFSSSPCSCGCPVNEEMHVLHYCEYKCFLMYSFLPHLTIFDCECYLPSLGVNGSVFTTFSYKSWDTVPSLFKAFIKLVTPDLMKFLLTFIFNILCWKCSIWFDAITTLSWLCIGNVLWKLIQQGVPLALCHLRWRLVQSEMLASHTLWHVFMQDCRTYPSGRTLFNAGTASDDRSRFRWSWKCVDNDWMEKGCKNRSVWRVDPTFLRPNHFL